MGHVYWNLQEVPRPADSFIDKSDGRVFMFLNEGKPRRNSRKKSIGHATSDTMMHPNDTYKYMFPELWKQYYGGKETRQHVLNAGMYALSLGIGHATGLYPALIEAYGPQYGNMIMDYAMFSILEQSNVSMHFPDRMAQEVTFSKNLPTDSWLSDFFLNKLSEENSRVFRDEWIASCVKRKINKVWLSIDGSNNDCAAQKADIAEKGHAKSTRNSNIVSYMYAVNAEDGCPVTYTVYNGGKVDSKAFQEMATYLHGHQIEIEGVILDRGFCTHDVIALLESLHYSYIVMLKNDTFGHVEMLQEYAETIRWNVSYIAGFDGLFGITKEKQLFAKHTEKAYVSLYFDALNGSQRAVALMNKILQGAAIIEKDIACNKVPVIPANLEQYLEIKEVDGTYKVERNTERWQKDINAKGFCSIASSKDLGAAEVNRLYHLRDASETQYMILKTQLGSDVTRVHYTKGIENKFAVCFIAAILRSSIMNACKELNYATTQMIREIDRIKLLLLENGTYIAIHDESDRQKDLLGSFDILPEDFNVISGYVNHRSESAIYSQIHQKPEHCQKSVAPKRGRPVGSKRNSDVPGKNDHDDEPQRGRGRPKGSLNKKTIERQAERGVDTKRETRGKGRPKGSKNKRSNAVVGESQKRRRGRPAGSRNVAKNDEQGG